MSGKRYCRTRRCTPPKAGKNGENSQLRAIAAACAVLLVFAHGVMVGKCLAHRFGRR